MRDGSKMMEGSGVNAQGKPQKQRMTWTPNADGTVRQHWEVQDENGDWKTSFDGKYVRR